MAKNQIQPYSANVIKRPYFFMTGLLFTLFGWLAVLYDPSLTLFGQIELGGILGFIVALMALPLWLIGTPFMLAGLDLSKHYHKVQQASNLLLLTPFLILLFFISTQFIALGVHGFILGVGLWLSAKSIKRKAPHMVHQAEQARHSKQAKRKGKAASQEVSIYQDASHLTLLLSNKANAYLTDLINAINKLPSHLPYLQKNHAYLAVSVNELVNDLTENTILRLDALASEFVHNGMVNAEEKRIFSQQHEPQVLALIKEHLDEVSQLNARILEKKMASFNEVGSSAESQFRNSVMELKILLRWFIAKTPDNQVSRHEVLLKRLEETTLKQMHDAFYNADTTDTQKAALQEQVDDLIAHFKGQSPSKATEAEKHSDPLLLEYSKNQELDFVAKTDTKDFIEFNAQYVKQLKKHWH